MLYPRYGITSPPAFASFHTFIDILGVKVIAGMNAGGLSISYSHTCKDKEKMWTLWNADDNAVASILPRGRWRTVCIPFGVLRHFTERCPSRGDPAVLGAIGGRFLLCPPSFSLPVASCGVINVCSTTSCLHTLTLGCQDMRAVSVSCRDWIKRHRVASVGQTDSCPGVRRVNVW